MSSIFNWASSFYKNEQKKWTYGYLRLYEHGISFIENEDTVECSAAGVEKKQGSISICYANINDISKATSTLIYSSIVIKVNKEAFWFSSFSNRNDVFNTLIHFWKNQLIGQTFLMSNNRNEELFKLVYETENTMMDAGRTLHAQGNQLKGVAHTMNMLHNDITVSERITKDIDSWFGAWRVKNAMKFATDIPERTLNHYSTNQIEYEMLFSKHPQESHTEGTLVMTNNSLEIFNKEPKLIYSFVIKEITNYNIHSPFDMSICKRIIGKPNIRVHVISTKLSAILETLEKVYKCELNYERAPNENDIDVQVINEISKSSYTAATNKDGRRDMLLHSQDSEGYDQSLKQRNQTSINDKDANEISRVLSNIKTLALDAGVELDTQIKQIDTLDSSVDRANSRIRSVDWKVKKLT